MTTVEKLVRLVSFLESVGVNIDDLTDQQIFEIWRGINKSLEIQDEIKSKEDHEKWEEKQADRQL